MKEHNRLSKGKNICVLAAVLTNRLKTGTGYPNVLYTVA
jgi:hypothetical protein